MGWEDWIYLDTESVLQSLMIVGQKFWKSWKIHPALNSKGWRPPVTWLQYFFRFNLSFLWAVEAVMWSWGQCNHVQLWSLGHLSPAQFFPNSMKLMSEVNERGMTADEFHSVKGLATRPLRSWCRGRARNEDSCRWGATKITAKYRFGSFRIISTAFFRRWTCWNLLCGA